jgi:hypothetical protein
MKKIKIFALLLVSVIFISCEKEETISTETTVEDKGYVVENGYIRFYSKETFINSINYISSLSNIEREKWERKINFTSQYSLVNRLINEELTKDSINRIIYKNSDLSKVDKREYHSDYYYILKSKGIIKIVEEGTQNEYWDYNVFDRNSTKYINEEGIFAIADTLYQISDKSIKCIKLSSNKSKNEHLIELNKSKNIIYKVSDSNNANQNQPVSGEIWADSWTTEGRWPSVQKRIKVGIELSLVEFLISTQTIRFKHNFYVKCQKTNLFNVWIYDWSSVEINGNWKIGVYAYPQYYENSVNYITNCSDLSGCVNPETGSLTPFGSIFIVNPNSTNRAVYWEINYEHSPTYSYYHWTAKRSDMNGMSTLTYNFQQ